MKTNKKIHKKQYFLLLIILLPLIVRVFYYQPTRIHGDDMLAAYFSAHYDLKNYNMFEPIPKEKGDWASQCPPQFFILQKIFFVIFGENLLTIKLSVLPYVALVALALFLIVRLILDTRSAVVSVILYSFFAPSLYLDTLGLIFISSTASFILFLYCLFLFNKKTNIKNSILLGLSCGLCYLFYTSSYIALGVLVFFLFFHFLLNKKEPFLINKYLVIFLVIAVILSPFVFYMHWSKNYYFFERIVQVSLVTAKLSETVERVGSNMVLSFKSFFQDGLGGAGGYNFGNLALFNKFNFSLLIVGSILSLFLIWRKKELIIIWISILFSFVFGMVLTIPPPPYHRFSIAFPLIIIIMTVPFSLFLRLKWMNHYLKYFLVIAFLVFYIFINDFYFKYSIKSEINNNQLKLAELINTKYPNRNIYVASFPGYAYEKIYYFCPNKRFKKIYTGYHEDLFKTFNPNERYLYVIIFPQSFNKRFQEKDKKGRLIDFSNEYSLFINY